MLDQPVPNPLSKNPNVHTHKVFAAVGLILIGTIIAVAGIWYYVEGQSGTATDETTTTKVSTSSAKADTKTDETADWKVYNSEVLGITIKYPKDWSFKDDRGPVIFGKNPDGSNEPIIVNISRVHKDSSSQQSYEESAKISVNDPISSSFYGTSNFTTKTRLPNVTIDSSTWIKFKITNIQDDVLDNSISLTTEKDDYYYSIAMTSGKSSLLESNSNFFDLMSSTFKFKKSSWIVYTNKDLGFSLRLPKNFTTTKDMVYFEGPTQKPSTDFQDGVSISFSTLNKINNSINSFKDTAEADMKKNLLQGSIGSGKATYTDFTTQGSDASTKVIFTELNDGRILKIQAKHGGAKDKEYLIMIDQILSTFILLD